jgi:hypothetical protein
MDDTRFTKAPSHVAYHVRENADGSAYFNRVGSAFAHKDGQGYSVVLDSVPVNGRITLRTPKERLQDMKSGNAAQAAAGHDGIEP